jgi:hypothetical protein
MVRFSSPPQQMADSLAFALQDLSKSEDLSEAVTLDTWEALAQPHWQYPHQVFSVQLQDLIGGNGLSHVSVVSWRFLLEGTISRPVVAAVEMNVQDGTYTFSLLNEGPFVDQTFHLIQMARYTLSKPESYELRAIRIPELYVFALWWKQQQGEADIIVPMRPTHALLKSDDSYSKEHFEKALQSMAVEILEFDFDDRPVSTTD